MGITIMNILACIALGLGAGTLSGLVGIGGGVVIIPALIFLFGMSQQQAQGTTLALMVPPIGLLAAWTYWKHGFVDLRIAALICAGFVFGGLLGAKIATSISTVLLKKIFGAVLLILSIKMLVEK